MFIEPDKNESKCFSKFAIELKMKNTNSDYLNNIVHQITKNIFENVYEKQPNNHKWGTLVPILDRNNDSCYLIFNLKDLSQRSYRIKKFASFIDFLNNEVDVEYYKVIPLTDDELSFYFNELMLKTNCELISIHDMLMHLNLNLK